MQARYIHTLALKDGDPNDTCQQHDHSTVLLSEMLEPLINTRPFCVYDRFFHNG